MASWTSFITNLTLSTLTASVGNRTQSQSIADNVYHCCVHKTGSQWIQKVLADPVILRYSGLKAYHYQTELYGGRDPRALRDRVFAEPFPPRTIVSPLYISYENFEAIPKPQSYKAFFVQRDPRDIVVSWYFSVRYSHTSSKTITQHRQALSAISLDDGILYTMDQLKHAGHFDALASWVDAAKRDPNLVVVRFEDLIGPANVGIFASLFKHCGICIPRGVLDRLLTGYSFEALTGRKPGQEDNQAHYRKGISGDWKNYLSDGLVRRLDTITNNLPARLQYAGPLTDNLGVRSS